MLWTREEKYFVSLLIWKQNHSKQSQNRCNSWIWLWFITDIWLHVLKPDIIIIIIMSCHQPGYPWSSLAIPLYRSSPLAGPQGYRAAVCRFELVALLLFGHVKWSTGEHHLWARPCFSSSILHIWFVKLW